ncbi:mechanosensitive ion channel family protein [Paludibaculum fermentans]|uniref:Mechanosensitive ion channel family protein n=1 Tax=Paludibaculum fermentans TaxID=1473598 RepID=A0A7S7NMD6_PALFE|nr:mechanosensitive ion channel family protein [Paludibaculum fermentans]QOY86205.1 mechanosensitive ion channel family protein [Paludibaculum fermentans]
MQEFLRLYTEWHGAGRFLVVWLSITCIFWLIKNLAFRYIRRAAARTETKVDDQVVAALAWPVRFWTVLAALITAVRDLDERDLPKSFQELISGAMIVLVAVSFTMAASRVSALLLQYYLSRSGSSQQVTTLTRTVIRVLWLIPSALLILNMLKINLAPALTALGVGGLAVSLALQGTLANLFSGFYVSMAGNIHRGDFIRLDNGQEGYVEDIRWRITTLRALSNNLVIIPNAKLAEAVVTNFTYPEPRMSTSIVVGVSYSSDIDRVSEILLEEARATVGEVDGLLPEPGPVVRLNPGFSPSSLDFTLSVHVAKFERQFAVQDALRRRVFKRFQKEGISIPYPVQTLDIAPGVLRRAFNREA